MTAIRALAASNQGSSGALLPIPLWFTIVTKSDGSSHLCESFAPTESVQELNAYFPPEIQFYVCGVTVVNSDDWYNLNRFATYNPQTGIVPSEWDQLLSYVHGLNPEYPKGYIDVLIAGGITPVANGVADRPAGNDRGSVLLLTNNPLILAHELGHYFTLPHTFVGGAVLGSPNSQYVDDIVTIQGVTYTCQQTGDGFCDTPADPGGCLGECNDPSNCVLDPLGKQYNIDRTLIMGEHNGCFSRFSENQKAAMVNAFSLHSSYNFLRDQLVPTCDVYPSSEGIVERNCSTPSQINISPIPALKVGIENTGNTLCVSEGSKTNLNGEYATYCCVIPSINDKITLRPDKKYQLELDKPDNFLNGITTLDLAIITSHILGIAPLTNPFSVIAADANNSGSVTTFDVVTLRKAILGIIDSLDAGNWRYVPKYCFFEDAFTEDFYDVGNPAGANPFDAIWTDPDGVQRMYLGGNDSWMDHVTVNRKSVEALTPTPWSFWGIKVGDVNCSALLGNLPFEAPPGEDVELVRIAHSPINTGGRFSIQVKALSNQPVLAWQLGFGFDEEKLLLLEPKTGEAGSLSTEKFGLTKLNEGQLRVLDFDETGNGLNINNKVLFEFETEAIQSFSDIAPLFQLDKNILDSKFYALNGEELEDVTLVLEVNTGGLQERPALTGRKQFTSMPSIHPVPFSDNVSFDIRLQEASNVELKIIDCLGRVIATHSEDMEIGKHTIRFNSLASYPSGLYHYIFTTQSGQFSGHLSKN